MDHYKSTIMLLYQVLSKSLMFHCVRILRYTIPYLHIYFLVVSILSLLTGVPLIFRLNRNKLLLHLRPVWSQKN